MEFGCRYFYVDDTKSRVSVPLPTCHKSERIPEPLPRDPVYAAPERDASYDSVQCEEDDGVNGVSDTQKASKFKTELETKTGTDQRSTDSVKDSSTCVIHVARPRNSTSHPLPQIPQEIPPDCMSHGHHAYLDVLPTDVQKQRTPPPVPSRRKKPPIVSPSAPTLQQALPANCNIMLLNIGKLVDVAGTLNRENPALCSNCSASISELNHGQEDKTWSCVFCETENPIGACEQYESAREDQLYLYDPQHENERNLAEDSLLIFCIDISGSMSATSEIQYDNCANLNNSTIYTSRMEAVKCGLLETLHFLHKQNPKKRVALVTFSDQVKIYGDGTLPPQVLEDSELLDPDYLRSQGLNQPMPRRLAETLCALESQIEWLQEKGATALGPAALVCIAMASQKPGSKVIICTDGKANTELGNLEDITEEFTYQSSKLFYSSLADVALRDSVVVSVLTIEGTDCRLSELGQLADKTGGKVNIVLPMQLANEFQSILEEEINATDVKVKVYLPNSMYFLYEGHTQPVLERTIGSTTPDTVLSLEFDIHASSIHEVLRHSQLPVQVQITFSLLDGRRGLRILSQKRPVTNDSTAVVECMNLNVLQIHRAQLSAHLAMAGCVNKASQVALSLKCLIAQAMKHQKNQDHCVVYEEWESSMSPIYEDLQVYMQVCMYCR
ncbi:hypothetical protein FKM82_013333 [Ascaphus truei]